MLCTLCQNYYYIQYATMWIPLHAKVQYLHSGYQLLINSMYFYCFHVFHREFLWPTGVNFNISYHKHQELLECQTFVTNHALFNASHSIYLFLAQWRLVLSESAVFINCYYCLLLFSRCTTRYMNYFTCVVKLNWNYRKNCAINAQVAIHLKLQL